MATLLVNKKLEFDKLSGRLPIMHSNVIFFASASIKSIYYSCHPFKHDKHDSHKPNTPNGPKAASDSCKVHLDLFKDMLRQRGYV